MNALATAGNIVLVGLAWVMSYTGLPVEPAAILAVLMCIDFFVGIGKSHAIGVPVTSRRMKVGAVTKCSILIIPLVLALTAKALGAEFQWLIGWAVSVFVLSETYSIVANIYTMRTGEEAPEWDVVALVMKKIRSMLLANMERKD